MALINCKECGKEVSSEAELCPHCGVRINPAKAPQQKPPGCLKVIFVSAAIIMAISFIGSFSGYQGQGKPAANDKEATLRGLCMLQIKSQLHDPDSAEFEHSSSTMIRRDGDTWVVTRPVRAKNAYNATRRAYFECRYLEQGSEFKLINIEQIGK